MEHGGRLQQLQYNYLIQAEKMKRKEKSERKYKRYYPKLCKIITLKLLLSNSFVEGKDIWIKFKEHNKMAQELPLKIPIVVKSFIFIKNITS